MTTANDNYKAIIAAAERSRDEKYTSLLPKPKRSFVNESNGNMNNSNNNINNVSVKYNLRNRKVADSVINNNNIINNENKSIRQYNNSEINKNNKWDDVNNKNLDKDNSGGNVDLDNGNMDLNNGNMEFGSRISNNNKIDELNINYEGFKKFNNEKSINKIGNGVKGKGTNTGERDNVKDKTTRVGQIIQLLEGNGTIRYCEREAYPSEY